MWLLSANGSEAGEAPPSLLEVMGRTNMEREKAKGARVCVFHSSFAFRNTVSSTNSIIFLSRVGCVQVHCIFIELV